MNFPIVYDKSARDFSNLGIAILDNASEIKIHQVVNGQYTLSLVLPRNDEKWSYIKEENIIFVDSQAFRIRSFDEQRNSVGKLTANIFCEHISYDLNDVKHVPDMQNVLNVSPYDVFHGSFINSDTGAEYSGILNDTPFTVSTEVSGTTDLFLSKTTPREVLNQFANDLECEILYDNFDITLVEKLGNENAVEFRIGKNLSSVKRTTDSSGLITRLYPYGKDYLDITSVNSKKAYIDSPLIDNYDYVHEGYLDFPEIDEPKKLLEKGKTQWSTDETDGIDKPKITYSITVEELKKISEFASFEKFSLGDTVTIYDDSLDIKVKARILEYTHFPYEPLKSSVVLSNFKENVGEVISDLIKTKNTIDRITTADGKINDSYIESVRNKLAMKFNSSLSKNTVVHDYADVWVDNMDNPTSAIALVDGMFALANNKNSDGSWNWRTIGSGGKLVADSVHSNWVYAGTVKASQIKSGTIYTDKVKIQSRNGEIQIADTSINMESSDGFQLNIDAESGVEHIHEFDEQGRPIRKTLFDSTGVYSVYYRYNSYSATVPSKTYYCPYINCIFAENFGGHSYDGTSVLISLYGPQYRAAANPPYVMVVPNEKLRFVRSDGGRIGDLSDYYCAVSSIEKISDGYDIEVESWKTYVSKISSNSPIFETASLKFQLIAIFQ